MSETENFKKTEKLASAVYLITGYFNDKEPMKWDLRGTAARLLSVYMNEDSSLKADKTFSGTRAHVHEIVALLSVAKAAGLVSDMNHGLVAREFEKLLDNLTLPEGVTAAKNEATLSEKFFSVPAALPSASPIERKTADVPEAIKDISPVRAPKVIPAGLLPEVEIAPKAPAEKIEAPAPLPAERVRKPENLKEFGAVAVKKNGRQGAIIALLKRKKEIMIKDVSPLIDGVSEKTIQRELLGMVKAGILLKVGEKRWSRYSLA